MEAPAEFLDNLPQIVRILLDDFSKLGSARRFGLPSLLPYLG